MINKVFIIGKLVNQPKSFFISTKSEKILFKLILKVNREIKNKANENIEDFIDIKIWSDTLGNKSFSINDFVVIEGRIASIGEPNTESYKYEILANKIYKFND